MNWTKEQSQAINEKGNILVSAAAGSGKTAVLVERIITKVINERVDIDKLLVVTFTNAAAKEMKMRVLKAINEKLKLSPKDEFLRRQKRLVGFANISTLHAFCYKLVKEYFYKLGVKSNIAISKEEDIELLKLQVLDKLINEKYEKLEQVKEKEEKHKKENLEFAFLVDRYIDIRGEDGLINLILQVINFLDAIPFKKVWINDVLSEYEGFLNKEIEFENTKIGNFLLEEINKRIYSNILMLKNAKRILEILGDEYIKYIEILKADEEILNKAFNQEKIKEKKEVIDLISFDRWPSSKTLKCEETEKAKEIRDNVKEEVKKYKELLDITEEELIEETKYSKKVFEALINLIDEFYKRFEAEKKEKNLLSFADLETFTLRLLYDEIEENGQISYKESEISKKLKQEFYEVQVDEYQDTNLVQEEIIKAISNNNLFLVGDIKQSIYKFRNAKPELFLKRQLEYGSLAKLEKLKELEELKSKKETKETKENIENLESIEKDLEKEIELEKSKLNKGILINLHKNFRSKENILEFCNELFKNIMRKDTGKIQYDETQYLNIGTEEAKQDNQEIEILIGSPKKEIENTDYNIKYDVEKFLLEIDDIEKEAIMVAKKIISLKEEKESKGETFKYSDIAILLRSIKNKGESFKETLEKNGVPCVVENGKAIFDVIEIEVIFNFLKIINNPLIDIELLSVMRSFFFEFTIQELTEIRIKNIKESYYESIISYIKEKEIKAETVVLGLEEEKLLLKCKQFVDSLKQYSIFTKTNGVIKTIEHIIYKTGYYEYIKLGYNGKNLAKLLDGLFKKFILLTKEKVFSLSEFLIYINSLKEKGVEINLNDELEQIQDAVKLMSIHKSKGLEFDTIILSNSNKKRNTESLKDEILLEETLGVGLNFVDLNLKIKYPTIYKKIIKEKITLDEIEEEMRILYVALTRAKKKLIITAIKEEFNAEYDKFKEKLESASMKKITKQEVTKKVFGQFVLSISSYYEYILLVLEYFLDAKLEVIDIDQEIISDRKEIEMQKEFNEYVKKYRKNREFKSYEYDKSYISSEVNEIVKEKLKKIEEESEKEEKQLPRKISVSNLTTRVQKIDNISSDEKSETLFVEMPEFMKQKIIKGKVLGNLYHYIFENLEVLSKEKYMQFKEVGEEKFKEYVITLLEKLKIEGKITEKEIKALKLENIYRFMQSEIYKLLVESEKYQKEMPFYTILNSEDEKQIKEILENADFDLDQDGILLQGVIDLYFETKEYIYIIDYKTDFVIDINKLKEKYAPQIKLYEYAILKTKPSKRIKKYIYSVNLKTAIEI